MERIRATEVFIWDEKDSKLVANWYLACCTLEEKIVRAKDGKIGRGKEAREPRRACCMCENVRWGHVSVKSFVVHYHI